MDLVLLAIKGLIRNMKKLMAYSKLIKKVLGTNQGGFVPLLHFVHTW